MVQGGCSGSRGECKSGGFLVVEELLLPTCGTERGQLPTIALQVCCVICITGLTERCPLPRQPSPLLYFIHPFPGGTGISLKAGLLWGSANLLCVCVRACVRASFSHVGLLLTPWTVACQAPLSMDSPGQNTRVGSHPLLRRILPTQR